MSVPDPLRLAFVGQRVYFHYCALEAPADGVEPAFFDFRFGGRVDELLAGLEAFAPHVVFVWRPEIVPAGAFDGLDAVTVGYLTEPLPAAGRRCSAPRPRAAPGVPASRRRLQLRPHRQLRSARGAGRRPHRAACGAPSRSRSPTRSSRRCAPPPAARRSSSPAGPPTHRDAYLDPVKHDFDVVHLAHGVTDEHLIAFLREVDVGVNLHNEPYPTFENRVSVYLAAGVLVISEPVSPRHGLQPGHRLPRGHGALAPVGAGHRRRPHARRLPQRPPERPRARPSASAPRGSTRASAATCWPTSGHSAPRAGARRPLPCLRHEPRRDHHRGA